MLYILFLINNLKKREWQRWFYYACSSKRLAQLTQGWRSHRISQAWFLRQCLSTQASDPLYRTKSPWMKIRIILVDPSARPETTDPSSRPALTRGKFQVQPDELKTPVVIANCKLHVNLLRVSTWKPAYQPQKITRRKPLPSHSPKIHIGTHFFKFWDTKV